jgi:hypothetical protein
MLSGAAVAQKNQSHHWDIKKNQAATPIDRLLVRPQMSKAGIALKSPQTKNIRTRFLRCRPSWAVVDLIDSEVERIDIGLSCLWSLFEPETRAQARHK